MKIEEVRNFSRSLDNFAHTLKTKVKTNLGMPGRFNNNLLTCFELSFDDFKGVERHKTKVDKNVSTAGT